MGQAVVANGLSHTDSHFGQIIALGRQIVVETLENSVNIIRVDILGLNMIQKVKEYLRVSVEEDHLKAELLTHLLPVPALVVNIGEGGVEEEGVKALVRSDKVRI